MIACIEEFGFVAPDPEFCRCDARHTRLLEAFSVIGVRKKLAARANGRIGCLFSDRVEWLNS
jgi:hypothetical protein